MRLDLAAPGLAGGSVPGVRTPILFSGATLALGRASPRLGEHTDEVLRRIERRADAARGGNRA